MRQVLPSRLCTARLHMEMSSGQLALLSREAASPLEAREIMGLTQMCEELLPGRELLSTFGTLGSHYARLGKATCTNTVLNKRYAVPGGAPVRVRKRSRQRAMRARAQLARKDKWDARAWAQQNARNATTPCTGKHPPKR